MFPLCSSVGGYFELELPYGSCYYRRALKYQSARAAFYDLIKSIRPSKLWIPAFICDSMIEPLEVSGTKFEFYSVNLDFSIKDNISLKDDEFILYVNYFGVCSDVQDELLEQFGSQKMIFDHSQAFFAPPKKCLATLYSPRKFFGVPDGGLLITKLPMREPLTIDVDSIGRSVHLLKRLAGQPEDGYREYQDAESSLRNFAPKKMSLLTQRLLSSIDYESIKLRRENNFKFIGRALGKFNVLKFDKKNISGPMVYPFLPNKYGAELKAKLIKNRYFVGSYWPDCEKRVGSEGALLVKDLVPLPCDQRYGENELKKLCLEVLNEC